MLVQPPRAAESVAEEQGTAAHHRREVIVPSLMLPWDRHCIWPHPCLVGWPFRPWHTTPCSWTSCNRSQNRDLMSTTGSGHGLQNQFITMEMPERDEWLTSLKRSWRKGPGQSPCVTVTTVQGDTVASLCERVECCHHLFIEANSSLKCYYGTLKPETDLQAGKPVALPAEGTKCTNTRGRRQCKLCHPGGYPRAE